MDDKEKDWYKKEVEDCHKVIAKLSKKIEVMKKDRDFAFEVHSKMQAEQNKMLQFIKDNGLLSNWKF